MRRLGDGEDVDFTLIRRMIFVLTVDACEDRVNEERFLWDTDSISRVAVSWCLLCSLFVYHRLLRPSIHNKEEAVRLFLTKSVEVSG